MYTIVTTNYLLRLYTVFSYFDDSSVTSHFTISPSGHIWSFWHPVLYLHHIISTIIDWYSINMIDTHLLHPLLTSFNPHIVFLILKRSIFHPTFHTPGPTQTIWGLFILFSHLHWLTFTIYIVDYSFSPLCWLLSSPQLPRIDCYPVYPLLLSFVILSQFHPPGMITPCIDHTVSYILTHRWWF